MYRTVNGWLIEFELGLVRHKAKIHERVGIPARNCDAASKIDPRLCGQESLKFGVVHSGDVLV